MASIVHPQRSILVYLLLGIFLLVSVQFALFLLGYRLTQAPETVQTTKEVYTREEFEKLILGKTADEVLQAVGRPNTTSKEKNVQYWHYAHCTKDPLAEHTDTDAQVVLEDGRVRAVNY